MAEEIKQPAKTLRKKIRRLQIGVNVLAQVVLLLLLALMINSIAFKHYKRWDFSRDQKYALSDKTKRFLNTIKGKVRITVFFSPNTPISGDVSSCSPNINTRPRARSTSRTSIRSAISPAPRRCSTNTKWSATKV